MTFAAFHSIAALQSVAQTSIEHALNALPAGLLIAFFAWAMLCILPRQNSRTRFAVWFLALVAVAAIPIFGTVFGPIFGPVVGQMSGGLTHAEPGSSLAWRLFAGQSAAISLPAHSAAALFVLWAFAALIGITRLALGLSRLRELRKTCSPVDPAALDPALRTLFHELNSARSFAQRRVTLASSDRVRVPAALGVWQPIIVFPSWTLRELSPAELSIILRHEFAHLRRWDDWTNLIQKFVRALFFFHPAVWWIESQLSVEREMACDDVVVAQTGNPTGYASCLVSLLERSLAQRGWTMAQAIVHRAREASVRLAQILDNNRPAATGVSKPALGLVGAFTLICLVMLPSTPQVVAFEQSPSSASAPDYAANLARPAGLNPAFVHNASLRTSLMPSARMSHAQHVETKQIDPKQTEPNQLEPKNAESKKLDRSIADPEMAARNPQQNGLAETADLAQNDLLADAPPAFRNEFFESLHGLRVHNPQALMQAMFAIQAAQFAEFNAEFQSKLDAELASKFDSEFQTLQTMPAATPDARFVPVSQLTVWRVEAGRVQVWHMIVVSPTWEREVRVPAAHST